MFAALVKPPFSMAHPYCTVSSNAILVDCLPSWPVSFLLMLSLPFHAAFRAPRAPLRRATRPPRAECASRDSTRYSLLSRFYPATRSQIGLPLLCTSASISCAFHSPARVLFLLRCVRLIACSPCLGVSSALCPSLCSFLAHSLLLIAGPAGSVFVQAVPPGPIEPRRAAGQLPALRLRYFPPCFDLC